MMQSKKAECRAKVLTLVQEHEANGEIPTNGRFIYYELKQRGYEYQIAFDPTKASHRRPDQYISEALTDLREDGIIPWDWITDETRDVDHGPITAATIQEWMIEALDRARINPWNGKPPFILVEDRATSGVIEVEVCRDYCVAIAATNGMTNGFLRTDVAPYLYPGQRVLYMGDHNRAGNDIEANSQRILEEEVGVLKWERVVITPAQIQRYHPPAKWSIDRRDGVGGDSWESESLGQSRLITIVRQRLNRLMRPVKLEDIRAQEAQEREAIRQILEGS